jgi:hypothetical protein
MHLDSLPKRINFSLMWTLGLIRFYWYLYIINTPLKSYQSRDKGTAGVEYSKKYFKRYSPDARIYWPLFLLLSIPDLVKKSLLILGPRYETELLLANSLGFEPAGLKGLDTHSYSPLIDVGDMHSMSYEDSSFNNIICGWTLSYSTEPKRAGTEMSRVLAPGGYLIVSVHKVDINFDEKIDGVLRPAERIQTLEHLDSIFEELVRVAGFEPQIIGESSHTLAAYQKPVINS